MKVQPYIRNKPAKPFKKGERSKKKLIFQYDSNLNLIKIWNSIKEAGDYFNIHPSAICDCAKRINKRGKVPKCRGYIWRYALVPTQS